MKQTAAFMFLLGVLFSAREACSQPAPYQNAPANSPPQDQRPRPGPELDVTPDGVSLELLNVRRLFVDRLTGGDTAAQMRDLLIASLQNAKLFVITENEERADVSLRGAAEDLIYTDQFQSSEGVNIHAGQGGSSRSSSGTRFNGASGQVSSGVSRSLNLTLGEHEESNIHERRHEAMATVRLVDKNGDVIWSTTQESGGAKFRGASADVADKITRALTAEYERAKRRN
jgi:hypothetical protein